LLLCVPLLALRAPRARLMLFSSVVMLALTAISAIVVWNTLLATLAGVTVGSFALGAALTLLWQIAVTSVRANSAVKEPLASA
jgi:hypothetical protein